MTFKELVLLISPFIIIGGLVWLHVFGVVDFLKWYRDRADEIDKADTIIEADKGYEAKVIARGNCMMCGKELTEGLFFCKECEAKATQGR